MAEKQILGDIPVHVYRTNADDGAELAITHIPRQFQSGSALPVILLHGNYTTRNFWISPKGIGMGAFLSKEGFDVWIPELRGHGMSPKGLHFQSITAEDQIRYDVPAIHRYVKDKTGAASLNWVGHSIGGVFILASLSAEWLPKKERGLSISMASRYCLALKQNKPHSIGVYSHKRIFERPEVDSEHVHIQSVDRGFFETMAYGHSPESRNWKALGPLFG